MNALFWQLWWLYRTRSGLWRQNRSGRYLDDLVDCSGAEDPKGPLGTLTSARLFVCLFQRSSSSSARRRRGPLTGSCLPAGPASGQRSLPWRISDQDDLGPRQPRITPPVWESSSRRFAPGIRRVTKRAGQRLRSGVLSRRDLTNLAFEVETGAIATGAGEHRGRRCLRRRPSRLVCLHRHSHVPVRVRGASSAASNRQPGRRRRQ